MPYGAVVGAPPRASRRAKKPAGICRRARQHYSLGLGKAGDHHVSKWLASRSPVATARLSVPQSFFIAQEDRAVCLHL